MVDECPEHGLTGFSPACAHMQSIIKDALSLECFVIAEPDSEFPMQTPLTYGCRDCAQSVLTNSRDGRPLDAFWAETVENGVCTEHLLRWYEKAQGSAFLPDILRARATRRFVVQLSTGVELVA